MELRPGDIVDRYVIDSWLGRGGMAVVYRVRHVELGSLHALKVLSGAVNSVRERLLQEGRVQAAMRHPNIVAVSDVVSIEGQPGLVMEYIEGPTLGQLLKERPLTLEQADVLVVGILDAVAAAHEQGLLHRDLKPANVLLQRTRTSLVPKVTDFGLAKLLSGSAAGSMDTRSGASLGTPAYMSPEQIRDSSTVDQRADVFALGAILYETVTGKRCFQADDPFAIFEKVIAGDFVPPRVLRPDLAERMENAILRALSTAAEDRPADAAALLDLWSDKPGVSACNQVVWEASVLDAVAPISGSPLDTLAAASVSTGNRSEDTWMGSVGDETPVIGAEERSVDIAPSAASVSDTAGMAEPESSVDTLREVPAIVTNSSSHALRWVAGLVSAVLVLVGLAIWWGSREGPRYQTQPPPPAPSLVAPAPARPASPPLQPGKPE